MTRKRLLLSFAGLVAAVVVVTGVATALHSDDGTTGETVAAPESDDERCAADATECEEPAGDADTGGDTNGGVAFGICIEGTVDCVDTPLTPTDGGDDHAVDHENPDQPVSSDVDPQAPLVDEGSGSASSGCPTGAEPECSARATEVALTALAERLGTEVEAIVVVSAEPVTWATPASGSRRPA